MEFIQIDNGPYCNPTWATAPDEYFWIDLGPFQDRFGEDWSVNC